MRDFAFAAVDLANPVRDFAFAAVDLANPAGDFAFAAVDLANPVRDFAFAAADLANPTVDFAFSTDGFRFSRGGVVKSHEGNHFSCVLLLFSSTALEEVQSPAAERGVSSLLRMLKQGARASARRKAVQKT